MSDETKKPVWRWIVTVLIGLPLLYVASFSATCWWAVGHTDELGLHPVPSPTLYWPFGWAKIRSPKVVSRAICWLATLHGEPLSIPVRADGEILTPCNAR
jgi:hypothetical protein